MDRPIFITCGRCGCERHPSYDRCPVCAMRRAKAAYTRDTIRERMSSERKALDALAWATARLEPWPTTTNEQPTAPKWTR